MGLTLKSRSGRSTALAFLMALLVIIGPIWATHFGPAGMASGQIAKTKVTLSLTPSEGHIDQTDEEGAAIFNGTITTQTLPIVVITVNITVEAGTWTNESSSPSLIITGNKDTKFTVKVYAPYNATADQQQDVKVSIKWSTSLNEKGSAATEVVAVVDQLFGVNVYATTSYPQIVPGNQLAINLIITNNGNGDDSFTLKLINTSTLENMGCAITLSKTALSLGMDGKETIKLAIVISKAATPNIYKILVNATSEGAKSKGFDISDDSIITIRVKDPGGGTDPNNTKSNKTKPWCAIGLIPGLIIIPLGISFVGARTVQVRRTRSQFGKGRDLE